MCINCSDFIDQCFLCGDPSAGPYGRAKKFYIGDRYCEHLAIEYGHEKAQWRDAYGSDD